MVAQLNQPPGFQGYSAARLALAVESVVEVDQVCGIESGEFPARNAATALWMMDHIVNNRLSLEFDETVLRRSQAFRAASGRRSGTGRARGHQGRVGARRGEPGRERLTRDRTGSSGGGC